MAKLEELVTPTELLDFIRTGAIKSQVVKKYRTSEQELAMMLLPLYRSGELTKEEFNDFFKGVPLRPKEAQADQPSGGGMAKIDDEPPSQILKSLSEGAAEPADWTRPAPVPRPAPEPPVMAERPVPEPVPAPLIPQEPEPEEQIEEEPEEFDAEEITDEGVAGEEAFEEAELAEEVEAEPVESGPVEEPEEEAVDFSEEPVEESWDQSQVAPDIDEAAAQMDAASLARAMELIIARLESIDNHLAVIARKLGS